jgi:NADPH2 dehydrogenase
MTHLLTPLQIGKLECSNRLVMPPMATAKATANGQVSEELIHYYREKTEGGYISLVIVEHAFITKEGKASNHQISIADDSDIGGLAALAESIKQNGSKAVMQVNHAGSAADETVTGSSPVGPSVVVHPWKGSTPIELTSEQITGIVKAFGEAARRAKEAGFDGVEIHSAHGYLLNQFLSPLTNKRTDTYGGDLNNRIRIHLEVIEAVRGAVGSDFPVFLRLGASDYKEGGTTVGDSKIAAAAFEQAGVDLIDISGGFCGYTLNGVSEQGYFSDLSEAVKKVVTIPVLLTGGITESSAAENLLSVGKADLIGVGRAILNDSGWAQNAIESLKQRD